MGWPAQLAPSNGWLSLAVAATALLVAGKSMRMSRQQERDRLADRHVKAGPTFETTEKAYLDLEHKTIEITLKMVGSYTSVYPTVAAEAAEAAAAMVPRRVAGTGVHTPSTHGGSARRRRYGSQRQDPADRGCADPMPELE